MERIIDISPYISISMIILSILAELFIVKDRIPETLRCMYRIISLISIVVNCFYLCFYYASTTLHMFLGELMIVMVKRLLPKIR